MLFILVLACTAWVQEQITCSNRPDFGKIHAIKLKLAVLDAASYTEYRGTDFVAIRQMHMECVMFLSASIKFDRLYR